MILGGTRDGRELARELLDLGHEVISSLAGRTKTALHPPGEVRVGHFGGSTGLTAYLGQRQIDLLINATHPFAAGMSENALAAASQAGVGYLRLTRDSWASRPEAANWLWVPGHVAAAKAASKLGGPVFLTIGRQNVAQYLPYLAETRVICRVVDPPECELPERWRLIQDRGPFSEADERGLLAEERVNVLVTKDSGGVDTAPKLSAAKACGVQIVMVSRPTAGGETVTSVQDALSWVDAQKG